MGLKPYLTNTHRNTKTHIHLMEWLTQVKGTYTTPKFRPTSGTPVKFVFQKNQRGGAHHINHSNYKALCMKS